MSGDTESAAGRPPAVVGRQPRRYAGKRLSRVGIGADVQKVGGGGSGGAGGVIVDTEAADHGG